MSFAILPPWFIPKRRQAQTDDRLLRLGFARGVVDRRRARDPYGFLEFSENISFGQNQVILFVDADLGAAILGIEDFIANLDFRSDNRSLIGHPARANCDYCPFLGLFLRGVGKEYSTTRS